MLLRLSQHITDCLDRAAEAARKATVANDPDTKADFEQIALNWSNLARNYQFIESLQQFLLDSERRRKGDIPEPPSLDGDGSWKGDGHADS